VNVRSAAVPIAVWAAYLAGLGLMLGLWGHPDVVGVILLGAAALEAGAIAIWITLVRPRPHGDAPVLAGPVIPLALGLGAMIAGLQVGLWLLLTGAGIALAGIVGLAVQQRRRA
jgi:hypothetical protein